MPGKAAEVWPGLEVERGTSLGAGRGRQKREQGREFNNNPTSGYHFSCLKSQGELRLPYFQRTQGRRENGSLDGETSHQFVFTVSSRIFYPLESNTLNCQGQEPGFHPC